MSKRKTARTARVELLPPTALVPRPDARAMLKQLVEDQVAEALASRDELLLRPFFDHKKVAWELRRLQTVPERRKWSVYFAQFGCVRCDTRERLHQSCGMCTHCYGLVQKRIQSIIRSLKNLPEIPFEPMDQEKIARKALKSAMRELPQDTKRSRMVTVIPSVQGQNSLSEHRVEQEKDQ